MLAVTVARDRTWESLESVAGSVRNWREVSGIKGVKRRAGSFIAVSKFHGRLARQPLAYNRGKYEPLPNAIKNAGGV